VLLDLKNIFFFFTQACKRYGGFYLGSIGGPAAILAQNCIKKVEVLEYPELGS
jgi:fumarate hydratase class I